MKMADAKQKRNEQLKRWIGSETDLEPPVLKKKKTKVKFDDGAVFLAACSSGDTEEVLRMLDRGADINYANVDGLTALHQACIDDNVDMVTFLVEHGACINQPDNEGWIPLHAAASCGYLDIAEYLISQGANVGVVNSEGETPLDIAEEEAMEELLQNEINRQGVDIEAARKEEERIMLRDARQWLNSGLINDVRHAKSGGTALHVAAAKGYAEVLKLLIQAGYDVNIKDYDGWTPLHAAAHWGKEEACRILVEHLCDMDVINKVGQTAFDVADEDVLGYLEELQKKQNLLLSEKKDVKKSPLIETTTTGDNNQSVKQLKSKETVLLEPEKTAPRIETLEPEKVDEEEGEGKKDESSCSSEEEEEEDSESENEADKTKSSIPSSISNSTPAPAPTSITVTSPTTPSNQVTTPTSPTKKSDNITALVSGGEPGCPALWRQGLRKTGIALVPKKAMVSTPTGKVSPKEEERKDESPASWRLGLRKTGSYGALAEISTTKEAQKEKDTAGVMRSASSPRLSSSLDNKDKEKEKEKTRLAYVAPSIPRRHVSTSDIDEKENRDSAASLVRSGSYTRRRWDEDLKNNDGTASQNRTSSYQRSTSHTLALGRTSSSRDLPAKSSSASSLEPNNSKAWQQPSSYHQSYSIHRSGSFGRRQDDALSSTSSATSTTTTSSVTSPTGHRSLLSRYWAEENADKEKEKEKESAAVIPTINTAATTTTTSTTGTILGSDGRERRRSYLTPVRDEESESQRKARSRQARQSRRSTQGVTLTDLQEAEKTIGRSRPIRPREDEKEEKEKQDKEKQEEKKETETKEDDYRSRYRSFEEKYRSTLASTTTASSTLPSSSGSSSSLYSTSSLNRPNSLSGLTSTYRSTRDTEREYDRKEREDDKDSEDKSQPRSIRDRRRPREKRRSTGVSFWTQDSDENDPEHPSDSDGSTKGEPQSDRLSRNDPLSTSTSSTDRYESYSSRGFGESRRPYSRIERDDTTDYKKLYEQILAENEKLKAQLRDTELELSDLKLQLEKATQRQERFADRSQLEMEKRERRALERKISDMEEELKTLPDLKADNQRLKDENGALIRVISKLSK
ncbi:protein phosphatase 1 regulatory subunit 12A isoform X2 [Rhinichthys klamathensis goyatoka]|uniref:protein phosphatase 1 regulatory subunit 12A isoform X2 n=1 Tax=Rhinichthys klamathensis goyatoka TaxID=3034132 RepID=UPI0024B4B149|nr:protein phosphatase 1 regulatory subunit 12A isoform X2 [Rhinichthys klamathensis goyatoka]